MRSIVVNAVFQSENAGDAGTAQVRFLGIRFGRDINIQSSAREDSRDSQLPFQGHFRMPNRVAREG